MSVTASRKVVIYFSGDFDAQFITEAADNSASPAQTDSITLASGANTITPPTGAKGVTIIPPVDNIILITLKGVTGDTGIVLHPTDPTSIGLNSTGTFVLTAAAQITGVRLVWS